MNGSSVNGTSVGLSRRERIMVGAAVLVAVVIGVPGLLLPTAAGKGEPGIPELQRQRREVQRDLAAARREVDGLRSRIEPRLVSESSRRLVRRMVLASQSAAGAAGLRVGDLKPMPVESVSGMRRVPLQVTVSAPFSRSVRFLYELERPRRTFQVDSVRMSTAGGREDRIDLELRLVGFLRGEEEKRTDDTGI